MASHRDCYNEEFANAIISCKGNTELKEWKEVRKNINESQILKQPVVEYLPKDIVDGFFENHDLQSTIEIFIGLEQAFLSLHTYAANLCGDEDKTDYNLIKVCLQNYLTIYANESQIFA